MKWVVWTSFGMFDHVAEPHYFDAETAEEAEQAYRDFQQKRGLGCDYVCGVDLADDEAYEEG